MGLKDGEKTMNTILQRGKNWMGRAALAAVALAGFAFLGAGTAAAHPRFYGQVYVGPGVVYGGPGYYYGPGPAYVGPVYGPYYGYGPYYRPYRYHRGYRYWDERGRRWRYR